MTLSIFVDDPVNPENKFIKPAGYEVYRKQLWGTVSMSQRAPLLAEIETNLILPAEQFSEFESQCRRVYMEAALIAAELEPKYGGGAEGIRYYMENFFEGLEFAREHKSELIWIW